MKTPFPDPFNFKAKNANLQPRHGFPPYRELLDNELRKAKERKIGVIDKLNRETYKIDTEKLVNFIRKYDSFNEEEGPSYLIFDNLVDQNELSLENVRYEAETLVNDVCSKEPELGLRKFLNNTARCDAFMWLTNLLKSDNLS